jgi:hypothetical protein
MPKLRIIGIELPKSFERVNERNWSYRVTSYWESIKVEDFKIRKDEFVAVNCLFRFENLVDKTVVSENPRDGVLDLIKKSNLSTFVHSIVNGCYDAPFL